MAKGSVEEGEVSRTYSMGGTWDDRASCFSGWCSRDVSTEKLGTSPLKFLSEKSF
jgi:hypothetical protein